MGGKIYRICAGRFVLHAHDGDVVEGYSLGGELEIIARAEDILCSLRSPAPIFSLGEDPEAVENLLASEFDVQIAQRRAQWGANDRGFESRFVVADPQLLLAASLSTLRDRLNSIPERFKSEHYFALEFDVQRAIHILRGAGDWPDPVPTLADLL